MIELFCALGEPKYSDVGDWSPWYATYDEAKAYGTHLIEVGNWVSFEIHKRFAHDDFDLDPSRRPRVFDHLHRNGGVA